MAGVPQPCRRVREHARTGLVTEAARPRAGWGGGGGVGWEGGGHRTAVRMPAAGASLNVPPTAPRHRRPREAPLPQPGDLPVARHLCRPTPPVGARRPRARGPVLGVGHDEQDPLAPGRAHAARLVCAAEPRRRATARDRPWTSGPAWSRLIPLPWPHEAGSAGSWPCHALGTSNRASQGPVGGRGSALWPGRGRPPPD